MIVINNDSNIPFYMQIYEQFKKQILTGLIPGGGKLPSIRVLSATLGVSRNTVESAYLQLSSEGYIESKPGSGFVALKLDNVPLQRQSYVKHYYKKETEKLPESSPNITYNYNFRNRSLSASDFPIMIWKKLSNQCLSAVSSEDFSFYNAKRNEHDLQVELMEYLNKSRGVSCKPEQIIISAGMESSLNLLCQLFRADFSEVALEDPGYMVARDSFRNNGFHVIPIGLEEDGINLEELNSTSARIVYITPSHQFPTGAVMPIKKRLRLLDWAGKKQGIIIEDDYDSEFRYGCKPIPSLQGIDSIGCVVYMGTFSKTLSPGLRINYMVLPPSLLERYEKLFRWYRVSVPFINQKILQQFMHQGYWDRHLRKIHLTSIKKHDLLLHAIQEYMGDQVIIHGELAGLHILLEFKNGLKEAEIIERAKSKSVLVSPVSMFWSRPDKYTDNMILLGFGGMPEDEIVEGIKALSNILIYDS